jgi:hypothetical protein
MTTTPPDIEELVETWTLDGHRPLGRQIISSSQSKDTSFRDVLLQLEFLAQKFYSRFIPALYPPHSPDFRERLRQWLGNKGLDSNAQRLLFEFSLRLAYFSFEDFVQLYRTAFTGPVSRWVLDQTKLKLTDPNFHTKLNTERKRRTWFCPVTDSMVISEFYHANGITGIDQRPAFRSLKQFGDVSKLKDYMRHKGLVRLVLIEDFVGSGTQTREVVEWAATAMGCPILFIPLILCPDGAAAFDELAKKHAELQVESTMLLDSEAFVNQSTGSKDPLLRAIAQLAEAIHPNVADAPDTSYGPFGFHKPSDKTTGAAVVLFSNTPDNSLPLLHHHQRGSAKWRALFPRVAREIL